MSVHDQPIFDLASLAWEMAEEAMGPQYFYRKKDFGDVEGFEDWNWVIRPGRTLNTDHILFIYDKGTGIKVGVDQYGDVQVYAPEHPATKLMAAIIADAKRNVMSREEVNYVESTSYLDIPDLSVRMQI